MTGCSINFVVIIVVDVVLATAAAAAAKARPDLGSLVRGGWGPLVTLVSSAENNFS